MPSYSSDDLDQNILKLYICPNVEDNSTDLLRNEIGTNWEKISDPDSDSIEFVKKEFTTSLEGDPDLTLRGIPIYQMESDSAYIEKIEVNPVLITAINENTVIPNFKIPVRFYGDRDNVKGDKFWNTFFDGGSWGSEEFTGLMNDTTVFYDEAFWFGFPYSKMETKLLGKEDHIIHYQITSNYHDYNESIQNYQDWSDEKSSELLIPNIYSYLSSLTYMDSLLGSALPMIDQVMEAVVQLPEIYKESIIYYLMPFLHREYESTLPTWEYAADFAVYNHSSSTEESIIKSYKNIIHDSYAMRGLKYGSTLYPPPLSAFTAVPYYERNNPYEISIKFPRHEQTDDTTVSSEISYTDNEVPPDFGSYSYKFLLRNMIEEHDFSAKFLEMLKDLEDELLPDVSYTDRTFSVQTSALSLGLDSVEPRHQIESKTIKLFDFLEFMTSIHNNFDTAHNDNYMFYSFENRVVDSSFKDIPASTTYSDNGLYRYADSRKILNIFDDTIDMLQKYMDIGIPTQTPVVAHGEEYDDYLEDSTYQGYDILKHILSPQMRYSEVLAYKIEKYEGTDTSENLQNFWFFNSEHADNFIEYNDTQIKYGKEYTYNCYAYVAIIAHKYRYGDFRLTKQIGTVDFLPDLGMEADNIPSFYCLQFYDPKTDELADQLFSIDFDSSDGLTALPSEREPAAMLPQFSALSQRNQYATKQQDLSMYPQLADTHLYIEPCIKILKVPMCSKSLAVHDNPGNTMTSIPFQFLDMSKKVGFDALYDDFAPKPYPVVFSSPDIELKASYLHAKDLFETDDISSFSESPARFVETYRITEKPTSYSDFKDRLISRIDLKIKNSFLNYSDYIIPDQIETNQKYYYMFRFVTENGVPGDVSQIIECELVDDGGYIYSLFNLIDESDFIVETYSDPSIAFKKIMQLEPNISQLSWDDSAVDYSKSAASQVNYLTVGVAKARLWDKKFKIRLTSKKTGKKLDINVTFNVRTENFTMTPIEDPA